MLIHHLLCERWQPQLSPTSTIFGHICQCFLATSVISGHIHQPYSTLSNKHWWPHSVMNIFTTNWGPHSPRILHFFVTFTYVLLYQYQCNKRVTNEVVTWSWWLKNRQIHNLLTIFIDMLITQADHLQKFPNCLL